MTVANPLAVLEPHSATNPAGEQAALTSSARFLLSRYERAPCDSPAVSACVRCNAVYLAKSMLRLTDRQKGEGR